MLRMLCVTLASLILVSFSTLTTASAATQTCTGMTMEFTLMEEKKVSPDSKLLKFALPPGTKTLAAPDLAPSGVMALLKLSSEERQRSYSPISLPSAEGYFELVVKAYPASMSGGMSDHLCNLRVGDSMRMSVKPPRVIHGSEVILGRWKKLGLIAGGTGIAPLLQVIRFLLSHPEDETDISLLDVNRHEDDILMRSELDNLCKSHSSRFRVTYCLTKPPEGWTGPTGRGTLELVRGALPAPSGDGTTMVMICGKDGFVGSWAGETKMETDPVTQKSKKVQGAIGGLLKDAGFTETEVYKF